MFQSSLIPFAIGSLLSSWMSRTDWWATSQSSTLVGQGAPSALSTVVIVKVMFLF
jgi:hypothetical protein